MCLDKLTSEPDPNFKGTVYKVLDADMSSPVINSESYELGTRYKAHNCCINAFDCDSHKEFTYISGFHCFFSKEDAISYMIRKEILVECEVEGLLARGVDCERDTGVFQSMTIKKEIGYKDSERIYHVSRQIDK